MIYSIQYLRAFAALLVLLTHAKYKVLTIQNDFMDFYRIGEFGVDLFFIISGFVMCLTFERNRPAFSSFMYSRATRIFPLYWILSFLALGIYLYNPALVNSTSAYTSVFKSFFLIPTDGSYLIGNGWTLSYEIYFYFIFGLFVILLNRGILFCSFFVLTSVAIGLTIESSNVYYRFITSGLLLEFVYGIALYYVYKHGYLNVKVGFILSVIFFIVITYVSIYREAINYDRSIFAGIPMLILFGSVLSFDKKIININFLKYLGDTSYSIYLVHPFVLSGVMIFCKMLNLGALVTFLALIASSYLASFILYSYIEKPLIRYFKIARTEKR